MRIEPGDRRLSRRQRTRKLLFCHRRIGSSRGSTDSYFEEKVGALDLAIGRDTQRVETIFGQLVDLPSPAPKSRLAATESALAAAKSEREATAKRLGTAIVKHRDLLESAGGLFPARRNAKHREPFEAATRNPASGRADYVLVPTQRGFVPAGRRSGERAVSIRRNPLYEREMPL